MLAVGNGQPLSGLYGSLLSMCELCVRPVQLCTHLWLGMGQTLPLFVCRDSEPWVLPAYQSLSTGTLQTLCHETATGNGMQTTTDRASIEHLALRDLSITDILPSYRTHIYEPIIHLPYHTQSIPSHQRTTRIPSITLHTLRS